MCVLHIKPFFLRVVEFIPEVFDPWSANATRWPIPLFVPHSVQCSKAVVKVKHSSGGHVSSLDTYLKKIGGCACAYMRRGRDHVLFSGTTLGV